MPECAASSTDLSPTINWQPKQEHRCSLSATAAADRVAAVATESAIYAASRLFGRDLCSYAQSSQTSLFRNFADGLGKVNEPCRLAASEPASSSDDGVAAVALARCLDLRSD